MIDELGLKSPEEKKMMQALGEQLDPTFTNLKDVDQDIAIMEKIIQIQFNKQLLEVIQKCVGVMQVLNKKQKMRKKQLMI